MYSCCGARYLPRYRSTFVSYRPLPLALLASSATGSARIAPHRTVTTAWQYVGLPRKIGNANTRFHTKVWIFYFICNNPFNQSRSFFLITPNRNNSVLKIVTNRMQLFTGLEICLVAAMLMIVEMIVNVTVRFWITFPVIFINNRILRQKFNRCVIRKLAKYPAIPYFGRRMNSSITSNADVMIL